MCTCVARRRCSFDAHLGEGAPELARDALGEIRLADEPSLVFAVEERSRRARLAVFGGELMAASIAADDALTKARNFGFLHYLATSLCVASQGALAADDVDQAGDLLREAVEIAGSAPYAFTLNSTLDAM